MQKTMEEIQKNANEMRVAIEKMSILEAKARLYDITEEKQAIMVARQAELTVIAGEEKMLKAKINTDK